MTPPTHHWVLSKTTQSHSSPAHSKDPNGSEVPGPALEKIYPVEVNLLQLLNENVQDKKFQLAKQTQLQLNI